MQYTCLCTNNIELNARIFLAPENENNRKIIQAFKNYYNFITDERLV